MKKSLQRKEICVYLAFLAFYLWMAAQIPYTHDDWDWGLPVGIQQLVTASLNSRYVGNFFEVVMTRSEFCKTVIMGFGFFLLPLLIAEVVSKEAEDKLSVFLLSNILILSMNSYIWRQTCGWIAGYANFCLSAVFLVVIYGRLLRVLDDTLADSGKFSGKTAALGALCLAGQMFIENIAIFLFLAALLANGIYWLRTKRISWEYLTIFAAAGMGLAVMFSSSIFRSLWNTGAAVDGYRQVFINSETNLSTMIHQCLQQAKALPFRIWMNNRYLCLAIAVLMSLLLVQKDSAKTWRKDTCSVATGVLIAFLLQDVYLDSRMGAITSLAFFAVITGDLLVVFGDNRRKLMRILVTWISPIGVILPIIFTTELGERLFFTSNVLLILFAGELICACLQTSEQKHRRNALLLGIAILLMTGFGRIYHAIGVAKVERDVLIQNAVAAQAEEIHIPRYPYQDYLWYPEPQITERVNFFKEFCVRRSVKSPRPPKLSSSSAEIEQWDRPD